MQKVTLLCLLLSLIFIGCSSAEFINPIYTALLSSANAVPNVGPSGAEGAAVCIYKRNIQPHTLDCEVQFTIDPVFGPFYAGIYLGDELTNGVEIFTFTGRLASGNFRQLFTIDTRTVGNMTYTAKQQEFDFLNGKWYIAISSEPYQLGALRGNLKHDTFMYVRLDEDNIVPIRPEDEQTGAHGIGLATYSYYNPRRIAEFYIIHDVANPTGVKIQRGDRNEIGYTDYSFSEFRSPVHEKVSYLYSTEQALLSGEQYMVISSPEYPTGEIRGQLTPIDQAPPVSFTARLDGSSLLPPTVTTARGCALFAIDCETFRLEYLIFHSVNNPTLAFMNAGDYRSNGPRIWPLARAESPIYGSRTLSSEEILDFYKGELYVTIGNDFYPNGEIRGQVTDKYNFYAYLSGINTIPPYTSSGVGCATFRMNENGANGRVIDYDIHFSVVDPLNVAVELVYGDVGASGIQIHQFNKTTSPVSGVDLYLDRAEENYFGTQRTYIQVGESSVFAGTAGQLRGQVYKTNSPCPFLTSRPVDLRSPVSSVFDNNYGIQKYFNFGSAGSLTPNHFVAVTVVSLLILLTYCFQ